MILRIVWTSSWSSSPTWDSSFSSTLFTCQQRGTWLVAVSLRGWESTQTACSTRHYSVVSRRVFSPRSCVVAATTQVRLLEWSIRLIAPLTYLTGVCVGARYAKDVTEQSKDYTESLTLWQRIFLIG